LYVEFYCTLYKCDVNNLKKKSCKTIFRKWTKSIFHNWNVSTRQINVSLSEEMVNDKIWFAFCNKLATVNVCILRRQFAISERVHHRVWVTWGYSVWLWQCPCKYLRHIMILHLYQRKPSTRTRRVQVVCTRTQAAVQVTPTVRPVSVQCSLLTAPMSDLGD